MRSARIKSALSQIVIGAIVVVGFFALWATQVPSARDWLDRIGVAEVIGLAPVEASDGAGGGMRFGPSGPASVNVAQVGSGALHDRITAIGDGRALRSVNVRAEASGRITEIAFGPGDYVEEDAVLFRLDSEAETIARDRAQLMLAAAQEESERFARLGQAGSATAVAMREAELALRTAELSMRQAEFDLEQRTVRAPISGWVGLLEYETGDRVSATEELVVLSDRSEILIDFRVPERVLADLAAGQSLTAEPLALPGVEIEGQVVAIDNVVDRNSRTVRVLGSLANEGDMLREGMSISVNLAFQGDPFPTVDPLAVQWSSDGSFVWAVRDGKAVRVAVDIRQRNADAVLVEGDLTPGEPVVVEGVQTLRPGAEVQIGEERAALVPGVAPSKS